MSIITFEEFARTHPLGKPSSSGSYTHYFTPKMGGAPVEGWVHYQVMHFNSRFPVEFCAGHCDILAALQEWIERVPELAALLMVERPLLIGDDFYVTPNRMHPTTLSAFDNVTNERYPPEAPAELATMRTIFREAASRVTEPRDRLLTAILERELFPPDNCHTWFDDDDLYFSVMDVATTYAEIDTWLDHEEWWVHPAVDPPASVPPATPTR
jgi:hypothetical protein